jgi:hypothetical protein
LAVDATAEEEHSGKGSKVNVDVSSGSAVLALDSGNEFVGIIDEETLLQAGN